MLLKISISKSKDLFNPIGVGLFRVLVCGGGTQLKAIPNLGSAISKVKVAKKMVNFKIVLTLIYAGFLDGTYTPLNKSKINSKVGPFLNGI